MRLRFEGAEVEIANPADLQRLLDPTTLQKLMAVWKPNRHIDLQKVTLVINGMTEDWCIQFSMFVNGSPQLLLLINSTTVEEVGFTNLRFVLMNWQSPGALKYAQPVVAQFIGSSVSDLELFLVDYSRVWTSIALLMDEQFGAEYV